MSNHTATSPPQCVCGETVHIGAYEDGSWRCEDAFCENSMPEDAGICESDCDTWVPWAKLFEIFDPHTHLFTSWRSSSTVCTQCMQSVGEFSGIKDGITGFQALAKGAMTRNRVLPAMLSADPTDFHQAVQYCANGYK